MQPDGNVDVSVAKATAEIHQALQALATTQFDPTLRQVLAELFAKERAETVAAQALQRAAGALEQLGVRVAELERRAAAAEEQIGGFKEVGAELRGERVKTRAAATSGVG